MLPDERLDQLRAQIGSVEDRIARIQTLLAPDADEGAAAVLAWPDGVAAKIAPVLTGSKPVGGGERGENPLRPQPQSEDEYVADLLGQDTLLMQQQRREIARLGICQCRLRRTPGDYYSWTLEQRRAYLRAPSVSTLCKSMLMVNKKAPPIELGKAPAARFYASHYLVIYQYEVKFVNEKLIEFLRHAVPPPVQARKRFNFRVASESDNDQLSGFVHNAVSPVGFRHALEVPFVLDQRIVDTVDFVWLGGGETDVKLAMSVEELIRTFEPIVAPVTGSEITAADAVEH